MLDELCTFKVLDPACGCGNFLYIAYRELRAFGVGAQATHPATCRGDRHARPAPVRSPYYPVTNLQGLDVEPSAVAIAKVTLWMGQRQLIDRYGPAEPPLPLQSLPGLRQADALRVEWPETDCIIGNPPFLGDRFMRRSLGDSYLDWLKSEFRVGVKDLCVYWFRRAADHLEPEQRAGLVGTNSVSQNRARSASLDYVVAQGGVITDAVSSQKWPGDAHVHVSIVNWVARPDPPPDEFLLDGVRASGIDTSLTDAAADAWTAAKLAANEGHAFYGPVPIGTGFQVTSDEARALLAEDTANSEVVRRYLTGVDIVEAPDQAPTRWTIDFGTLPLEDARRYSRSPCNRACSRQACARFEPPRKLSAALVAVR